MTLFPLIVVRLPDFPHVILMSESALLSQSGVFQLDPLAPVGARLVLVVGHGVLGHVGGSEMRLAFLFKLEKAEMEISLFSGKNEARIRGFFFVDFFCSSVFFSGGTN